MVTSTLTTSSVTTVKPSLKKSPLTINQQQHEFIEGLIASDAYLTPNGVPSQANSNFRVNTASEDFSDYIVKQLPFLNQAMLNVEAFTLGYCFATYKQNSIFNSYRDRWYIKQADGSYYKEIPFDFNITPTSLLAMYLGDGSKNINNYSIRLHTEGFKRKDTKLLSYMISDAVGVPTKINHINKVSDNPYVGYDIIYISGRANVQTFLEYIGDCPVNQYRHKWLTGLTAQETMFGGLLKTNTKRKFQVKAITSRN
jgi:hypothetical protein